MARSANPERPWELPYKGGKEPAVKPGQWWLFFAFSFVGRPVFVHAIDYSLGKVEIDQYKDPNKTEWVCIKCLEDNGRLLTDLPKGARFQCRSVEDVIFTLCEIDQWGGELRYICTAEPKGPHDGYCISQEDIYADEPRYVTSLFQNSE